MSNNSFQIDIASLDWSQRDRLDRFLQDLMDQNGSDLHLKSDMHPKGRVNGELVDVSKEIIKKDEMLSLAKVLTRSDFKRFVEQKSIDFSYEPANKDIFTAKQTFRVNLFFTMTGVSAAFRAIPDETPRLENLYLPDVIQEIANKEHRGLIIVTGPTGSGKSTTLAGIIGHINEKFRKHIITVEDPIEFRYAGGNSLINQRAIGQDAISFADSLRAALREDPDIILVGEMRDLETIDTALLAAETGHLVLSTMHTIDASECVGRMIGMFPGPEQQRIRAAFASTFKAVIAQRLTHTTLGERRAIVEVMRNNFSVAKLILEGREKELYDAIKSDKNLGMQTFEQDIVQKYHDGILSKKAASELSTRSSDLRIDLDKVDATKAGSSSGGFTFGLHE